VASCRENGRRYGGVPNPGVLTTIGASVGHAGRGLNEPIAVTKRPLRPTELRVTLATRRAAKSKDAQMKLRLALSMACVFVSGPLSARLTLVLVCGSTKRSHSIIARTNAPPPHPA
jgi:hypothetical protein